MFAKVLKETASENTDPVLAAIVTKIKKRNM